VGREYKSRTLWHFINLVNEDSPALFKSGNNMLVVNDFLANIDRSSVVIQGLFDGDDSSVHTSAVTPRGGQEHAL
jgi:hypothetical protein